MSAATVAPAAVKAEWAEWIRQNHSAVRSVDAADTDYSDLRFLLPLLEGRRVVALGESSHGVGEFDAMKVRLVQFLHEEAGFDVIAFESGTYECFRMDEQIGVRPTVDIMKGSIFGVWQASETLSLFEYLERTRTTGRPLTLAGFDSQVSSSRGIADRPQTLHDVLGRVAPDIAEQVLQADTELLTHLAAGSTDLTAFLNTDGDRLSAVYETATAAFDDHRDALRRAYPDRALLPLVLRQSAWSMPRYIAELRAGLTPFSNALRDEAMATNVDALLDTLYPGQKVILWAHNVHLQHDAKALYAFKNMGSWLHERRGQEMYVVGLFMHDGKAAQNDRALYDITAPRDDSLEAIFHQTGAAISFVDLLNQSEVSGNAWMFQYLWFKEWGNKDLSQVPRDQFDGILFVETVHPPHYL